MVAVMVAAAVAAVGRSHRVRRATEGHRARDDVRPGGRGGRRGGRGQDAEAGEGGAARAESDREAGDEDPPGVAPPATPDGRPRDASV
ncbi:hypothetical protein GCM10010405_56580 [Streptomyces macrosporus]|uniref:Uncharacterized protein n=1 Tax=Streptomyces macrosporus TaxID=44032 RepID=A0ABP5XU57_9ACTN